MNGLLQRLKKTALLIGGGLWVALLMAPSCFGGLKEEVEDIVDACDGMSLDDLQTQNSLSPECRAYIDGLLPGPSSDLENRAVSLGIERNADGTRLFTLLTDADGAPLDLTTATVELRADGELLAAGSYSISAAADIDGTWMSISGTLDYSSSMLSSDIDDAVDVFTTVFSFLPDEAPGLEAAFSIFSTTVQPQQAFTSVRADILSAIERDESFARESTALFDAMGAGIDSLATRTAPVRLLVAATDGGENASVTWTDEDALLAAAQDADVRIIIIGSLLSDRDFMHRVSSATDGFYFYAKSFNAVADGVEALADALA